jgi:hypothetical protein
MEALLFFFFRQAAEASHLGKRKGLRKYVFENTGMRRRNSAMLMAQPKRRTADLASSSQVVTAWLAARKRRCIQQAAQL